MSWFQARPTGRDGSSRAAAPARCSWGARGCTTVPCSTTSTSPASGPRWWPSSRRSATRPIFTSTRRARPGRCVADGCRRTAGGWCGRSRSRSEVDAASPTTDPGSTATRPPTSCRSGCASIEQRPRPVSRSGSTVNWRRVSGRGRRDRRPPRGLVAHGRAGARLPGAPRARPPRPASRRVPSRRRSRVSNGSPPVRSDGSAGTPESCGSRRTDQIWSMRRSRCGRRERETRAGTTLRVGSVASRPDAPAGRASGREMREERRATDQAPRSGQRLPRRARRPIIPTASIPIRPSRWRSATVGVASARTACCGGSLRRTPSSADLQMVLHNSDGSVAEISGNGIRCLAQAVLRSQRPRRWLTPHRDRGGPAGARRDPTEDPLTLLVTVDMGEVSDGPPGPPAAGRVGRGRRRQPLDRQPPPRAAPRRCGRDSTRRSTVRRSSRSCPAASTSTS